MIRIYWSAVHLIIKGLRSDEALNWWRWMLRVIICVRRSLSMMQCKIRCGLQRCACWCTILYCTSSPCSSIRGCAVLSKCQHVDARVSQDVSFLLDLQKNFRRLAYMSLQPTIFSIEWLVPNKPVHLLRHPTLQNFHAKSVKIELKRVTKDIELQAPNKLVRFRCTS